MVTFRCQEGMTFEGPSYRTICQADGRWSHPLPRCYAPCVVPHISHGFVADRASGSSVPHTQTIDVRCLSQFQKTHNSTPVCKNGTWSRIPKCIPGENRKKARRYTNISLVESVRLALSGQKFLSDVVKSSYIYKSSLRNENVKLSLCWAWLTTI